MKSVMLNQVDVPALYLTLSSLRLLATRDLYEVTGS